MPITIWTEEIVARLKVLCQESHSNALIAAKLSSEFCIIVTRNAVIGKRARDGIASAVRPASSKEPRSRNPPRRGFANFRRPIRVNGYTPIPIPVPSVFPHACALMDLTNTSCRFPCGDVGTKDFFFCGSPEADFINGQPYCPAHTQVVHQRS